MTKLALTWIFLSGLSFCYKVFLFGGAVLDSEAELYNMIAFETGRIPQPNKCSDDWTTTICPRIAVVTSASPTTQDGDDEYYVEEDEGFMSFEKLYKSYGFSPKHITAHIDNYQIHTNPQTKEGAANLNILRTADLVIFNGGDQSRHSRTWLLNNGSFNYIMAVVAKKAKDNQIILAGTSAGTMIMCNPTYGQGTSFGQLYFTQSYGLAQKKVDDGAVDGAGLADVRNGTDCLLYDYNGGKMHGFGFVMDNIVTDTHFDRRSRLARLIPAVRNMNKTYGVGVDEPAVFYLKDDVGIALATEAVFIVDVSQANYRSNKYFKTTGVRVHYLTKGDQFNFTSKQLVTSKPLISQPRRMGFTDSTNITSKYEMTRLITALIDQTASFNIGTTAQQQDFPVDTPTFTFTFSKDVRTRGYLNGVGIYTAQNVLVSVSN